MAGEMVSPWGSGKLPKGPEQATWYDKYGRAYLLPADPYSLSHYMGRGLMLHPPESPAPLVEERIAAEPGRRALAVVQAIEPVLEVAPSIRKRGPDKKPRKRRKRAAPNQRVGNGT